MEDKSKSIPPDKKTAVLELLQLVCLEAFRFTKYFPISLSHFIFTGGRQDEEYYDYPGYSDAKTAAHQLKGL